MDNLSRFAKPSSAAESGRRTFVNEMSMRLRFGTSGIKALKELSEREEWRSLNVRRAGREKVPLVSNSVCSFATVVSVYKSGQNTRDAKRRDKKIDPGADTCDF